jgi:peptidyl-prolyl cis-trans isomerase B (cyclophilin B)
VRTARLLGLTLAALALLVAGCDGSDDATTTTGETASGCRAVDAPAARDDGGATPPSTSLDQGATYTLTFATNCGDFVVTLDQASAPKTAASLVSLADQGFYDDTVVHRIVPDFVIQGGDPTQTGGGGPGYATVDAPAADAGYPRGTVAMAKTADEAPGASGSQWFVVLEDAGLPPEYAIVGEVTEGMDVVDRIGAIPSDPATDVPREAVVVSSVTVAKS